MRLVINPEKSSTIYLLYPLQLYFCADYSTKLSSLYVESSLHLIDRKKVDHGAYRFIPDHLPRSSCLCKR